MLLQRLHDQLPQAHRFGYEPVHLPPLHLRRNLAQPPLARNVTAPIGPYGGWLRAVDIRITATAEPRYNRPPRAADRTRSRRALAGSRRGRRHGAPLRGPSGRPVPDWPFGIVRSLLVANR